MTNRRGGFALIAVLWLTVMLSVIIGLGLNGTRLSSLAAANRVSMERSRWAAEGCLAEGLAQLDTTGISPSEESTPVAEVLSNGTTCEVLATEPQAALNVDSASGEMMSRLDSILSLDSLLRDSFVTRDGDGRIDVNLASAEVIAVIPGMTDDGARTLVAQRRWRKRLRNLSDFRDALPARARDSLDARISEVQRIVTFEPAYLVLRSVGHDSRAPPKSTLEVLVVPVGNRVAVLRRRTW
jgi:type II secretory pathway component PulK